ncbi:peptide deformylase [Agarivorans sp. QJM3NY_25]|uniref:peptide deformylase n=1 Tax=Agarivorans sp. QJM3NY_25 TaxID=3421430 RepID=UPI003D7E9F44
MSQLEPLTLLNYPNPMLSQVAEPLHFPLSAEQLHWIERLRFTMTQANGVGIAAPQVGRAWQLMIVASSPNARYPDAPELAPFVLCNPQIKQYSEQQQWGWEGCLSVAGQRAKIARSQAVWLEYQDLQGEWQQAHYQGFVARIIQHEYDHLQGLCIVDRVSEDTLLISEQQYLQDFS